VVIKAKTHSGFSQNITETQAKYLLSLVLELCAKKERIVFISNFPKDLERKVFGSNKNYQSFSGWQYGILGVNQEDFVRSLWSFSYGTPLYFVVTSDNQEKSFEAMETVIKKIRKSISGLLSFFTYRNPMRTEVPILSESFEKIAIRGHDGETFEVYTAF